MAKSKIKDFAEEAERDASQEAEAQTHSQDDGDPGGGTEGGSNVVEFGKAKPGANDVTMRRALEAAQDIIVQIEEQQAKIDEIMAKAKDKAAPYRDKIKALTEKARTEYSVEKSVLSVELTDRKNRRRIAAKVEKLKPAARDQYDFLRVLETEKAAQAETPKN